MLIAVTGAAGADDLGNMFQFKPDFEASSAARATRRWAGRSTPGLQTFAQWLSRNESQVKIG